MNKLYYGDSLDIIRHFVSKYDGLGKVLGKGALFAYLVSMIVRMAEIHRALKEKGSFYNVLRPDGINNNNLV